MERQAKTLGVRQVLDKKYKMLDISPAVEEAVGRLPDPFSLLVVGRPKNGKTSFVMWLVRQLAEKYKTFYSSLEEGDSKTIQEAFVRADMEKVAGKLILGDGFKFDDLVARLESRNSPKIVVIDSLDYMHLTKKQFDYLQTRFKTKSFILICWGDSSKDEFAKPQAHYPKQIKYQVGGVTLVKNFTAYTMGRYGMGKRVIWAQKAIKERDPQLKMFA